jgi:hypothetical protein
MTPAVPLTAKMGRGQRQLEEAVVFTTTPYSRPACSASLLASLAVLDFHVFANPRPRPGVLCALK